MKRWNRRLMLAVAAVLVMALGHTATAQASTTIVDGGGLVTDDWGDHGGELDSFLCNGCANSQRTDLVLMWQTILYAEGFLVKSAIDGYFGSGTATATKKWQLRYNLTGESDSTKGSRAHRGRRRCARTVSTDRSGQARKRTSVIRLSWTW